ncbi:MAG TPA: polyprenol phosphomannose-dependent alpha 1,6 mannosyltransferase MptB [Pseudonocardiaceae bacterium]|nr:polyprenol phosphomannose-dependent alpha 1,6 mannosyltransferase MptB [Pseudonocardiaceae bacterium]
MAETQLTRMVQSVPTAADLPADGIPTARVRHASGLSKRTVAQGTIGSVAILIGSLGAGGDLIQDPILGNSPFAWIRFGHGQQLAQAVLYIGVGLLVWAWVRLGRDVLAKRVTPRAVLVTGLAWITPMIVSPPTFTRDVFSYLGQGEQLLRGIDPYAVGPSVLGDTIALNVHPFWQTTPAPYGPLFLLLAKGVAALIGEHLIIGVILMRLVLMVGLLVLVLSLPGLVDHLGGRLSVAFWLMVASPMTVIHLVGGPHNDLLMLGLLASGVLLVLNRRHVSGIALVTLAMAVKATAGVALPFLMWVWAARLEGTLARRFVRASAAVVGIVIVVFGACMAVARVNFGWIGALHAPTMIVNWTNLPTGVGEITHVIVNWFGTVPEQPFVNLFRFLGIAGFVVLFGVQWWKSRTGGPAAVRRMALTLLAAAILVPPTLPWYLTWGLAILSAAPWKRGWLAFSAALAVLILLVYYPNGEGAMGSPAHMIWVFLAAILTGWSMLRFDPLGLRDKPAGHDTLPGDVAAPLPPEPETSALVPAPAAHEADQEPDGADRAVAAEPEPAAEPLHRGPAPV